MAFRSVATNLVAGDTNAMFDIFVKDLTTRAIQRVSTDLVGVRGDFLSLESNFSPDGTRLIFSSDATNLITGDANGSFVDVFIGALNLVSVTATDAVRAEGMAGTTLFSFPVSRIGLVTQPLRVDWAVAGTGMHPADAADPFVAGGRQAQLSRACPQRARAYRPKSSLHLVPGMVVASRHSTTAGGGGDAWLQSASRAATMS